MNNSDDVTQGITVLELENTPAPQPAAEKSAKAVVPFEKTNLVGVEGTSLRELSQLAQTLQASGLTPKGLSWQAVFTVILQGQELGLPPVFSMNNIYVVHNRPQLGGRAVFALVTRDFGNSAIVVEEREDDHCTVSYIRPGWGQRKSFTYTAEMAAKAGLLIAQKDGTFKAPDSKSATWDGYRAEMLQWKAIARVGSIAFPDCLGGLSIADSAPEMPVDVDPTDEELESEFVRSKRNEFWSIVGDTSLSDDSRRAGFLRSMSRTGKEHLTDFIAHEAPEIVEEMLVDAKRIADYDRQVRADKAAVARREEEKQAADRRHREKALASVGTPVNRFVTHVNDALPEDGDTE